MKFKFDITKDPKSSSYVPLVNFILENPLTDIKLEYIAMVDSGAFMSIFHSDIADLLGIDLSGKEGYIGFGGVGSGADGLEGKIRKVTFMFYGKGANYKFKAPVIFSDNINPNGMPLLGMRGFFDNFKDISFDMKNKKLNLVT